MSLGIFYGSTTTNTENAALSIAEKLRALGDEVTTVRDIAKASLEELLAVDVLLCGASTWDIGELQYDWDEFLPKLKGVDLSGKAIAFFGMGDAIGYPYNYLDCLGELWDTLSGSGAQLIGRWPTEGYSFDESRAETEPGWFLGLGLDEDNESELTDERIDAWLDKVRGELAELFTAAGEREASP